jgi:hypothetical protein
MLAALGNLISGSPFAIGATVVGAVLLGAWTGCLAGAIMGGVCGVVLVTFGSIIGGSAVGVVLTILACALLGGWACWSTGSRQEERPPRGGRFRPVPEETATLTRVSRFGKELVPWN